MSNIQTIRNKIRGHFKKKKEEHDRQQANRRNTRWSQFYQSHIWQTLRARKKAECPCCEMHAKYGIYIPADCVHHIKPFSFGNTDEEKWLLFTNKNNLMSLCNECHAEFHRQLKEKHLDYLKEIVPVDIQLKNI